MKPLFAFALAIFVALASASSPAQPPEPTYEQTRDWIVSTLNQFSGYTQDNASITYRDISMDGCHLRFTVSRVSAARYTDIDTFSASLDSVKSILWGTVADPPRAYVIFTTASPISFHKRRIWNDLDRQPEVTNSPTTIGALEFGKPGDDYTEIAGKMKVALLHAADLCKVQLAAKYLSDDKNKPFQPFPPSGNLATVTHSQVTL